MPSADLILNKPLSVHCVPFSGCGKASGTSMRNSASQTKGQGASETLIYFWNTMCNFVPYVQRRHFCSTKVKTLTAHEPLTVKSSFFILFHVCSCCLEHSNTEGWSQNIAHKILTWSLVSCLLLLYKVNQPQQMNVLKHGEHFTCEHATLWFCIDHLNG